ncbi:AMP-binding protein [Pseudonocardia xishanensis]|uniref:AMP-dependent synthetase/ligase domain-containing protein n=1 Tax=Pseudonocardia xishanensis TaxID=630995 RepID=A0ABP8REB9_9PSEU
MVNPYLPEADRDRIVDRIGADPVVVSEAVVSAGDGPTVEALVAATDRAPEEPAEQVPDGADLYVQFTSGTTGAPKGAVHRHGDLAAHHRAVSRDMLGISATAVSLSISTMFFAYGFGNSLVYPLFTGSSAVLRPERPDPGAVAELVDRHRVTVLHGVPSAYAHLVADTDPAAFATVRVAVSAGENLPPAVAARTPWNGGGGRS